MWRERSSNGIDLGHGAQSDAVPREEVVYYSSYVDMAQVVLVDLSAEDTEMLEASYLT